jgi:colanic acid biosynthesis glycosyl transferase WcaI
VLTHLCAGRAQVAAVPHGNAAARVIQESRGGVVVDPRRPQDFVAAVLSLAEDSARRAALGRNGRAYAEGALDVRRLGQEYEAVIDAATAGHLAAGRAFGEGGSA